MEKAFVLEAQARQTGSKAAAKLRNQGQTPAVVYGHKQEAVAVSLDAHAFVEHLHHGRRVLDIELSGKKQTVVVKDLQYDHLGKEVIHVDLMRVSVTETIKVAVPIELKGTAKGVHEGGIVESHAGQLEIECRVTDIPESIVVSVKDLNVGDSLHARDIVLPAGVKLAGSPETLVVSCRTVAEVKTTEELEAETPVVPEVITEVKRAEKEQEASAETKEKEKK